MKIVDVSVIIPVYNCEKYLQYAIDSVLNQTKIPTEIIVIDDGSTDQTKKIIDSYKGQIKSIFKEHSGLSDTLNVGIKHAKGKYLAFLDADDLWIEEKLEIQFEAISENNVDMVFGYIEQFISPELNDQEKKKVLINKKILPGYSRDTLFIKKDAFFKVGFFSSNYQLGEFIEWYSRAKDLDLSSIMLPNILAKRRIHLKNMTRKTLTDRNYYAKMIKSILERRRSREN